MPDNDDPSEGRVNSTNPARSALWELKSRLMRRAFDGESRHTPAEMILLIQWRLSASNIAVEHRKLLDAINPFGMENQPRSVMMLNRLAQEHEKDGSGVMQRFEYNPANVPAPTTLQ